MEGRRKGERQKGRVEKR
jgi:hypothetical protein